MCQTHTYNVCFLTRIFNLPAYSSDAVYLYSTRDHAEVVTAHSELSVLLPNSKSEGKGGSSSSRTSGEWTMDIREFTPDALVFDDDEDREQDGEGAGDEDYDEDMDVDDSTSDDDDNEGEVVDDLHRGMQGYDNVPVVLPRRRFTGACNVETVKDGE
jgi:hypothetical protein